MNRLAMQNRHHAGITIHQMKVGGDFGGGLFVAGIIVAALVGVPAARYFLVFAGVLGAGIGAMLHWMHRGTR